MTAACKLIYRALNVRVARYINVKVTGKRCLSARYCVGGLYCYVRLTAKCSDQNFSRQLLSWTNLLQFVRI